MKVWERVTGNDREWERVERNGRVQSVLFTVKDSEGIGGNAMAVGAKIFP